MTTAPLPITDPSPAWTTADRTAVRSPSDDLRALPAALRSEWVKITALRSTRVIVGLTAAVGAVVAGGLAATATGTDPTDASVLFVFPLPLVAMLASVTGILLFTGEAQHGSLAITLIARPARWVTVAAKTITAAGVGATLGVTGMAGGFVGAAVGGAELGGGPHLASRAAWALLYIVLAALVGLGVGMIARHSAAAVTGLLLWSFVIEGLVAPIVPEGARHALPFSAGYRLLDAGPSFEAPVVIAHQLGRPLYALVFAGYAVAGLVVGTALLYRRDGD